MSGQWEGSTRKARLPRDWHIRRARAKRKATATSPMGVAQCEWSEFGIRCTEIGTDCDHIDRHGGDREDNLQWLCRAHHLAKSSSEGGQARAIAMRVRSRTRPRESHPGDLPT